jgi:dihydroorotase
VLLCVRGAERVLDPGAGVDGTGEVWVKDGRVLAVGETPGTVRTRGATVLDARGALVTPMFVDLHVHLREPGGEAAETIETGALAALAGGFCTVFAMPNTDPPCDRPEGVARVLAAARRTPVEVVPVSALSMGLRGRELVDMDAMLEAGAGAFSDDGAWLADDALAERAFAWAARNDALVMQHCEDFSVTGPGVLHDAEPTRAAGWPGIPREAEDRAVARDLALAARSGARLHVCHVSTRGAIDALRAARAGGARVSGEATPHHLVLAVEDAIEGGTDFKMKPPLRERDDVDALVEALADGTIEAVATDHAPHLAERKACGMLGAPFGAIGMETAFPVLHTHLVETGRLALERLVAALTIGPSRIAGRVPPTLRPGARAALNVVDLARRSVVREALRSRSRNCPFAGMALTGWPRASVLEGRVHGGADAV